MAYDTVNSHGCDQDCTPVPKQAYLPLGTPACHAATSELPCATRKVAPAIVAATLDKCNPQAIPPPDVRSALGAPVNPPGADAPCGTSVASLATPAMCSATNWTLGTHDVQVTGEFCQAHALHAPKGIDAGPASMHTNTQQGSWHVAMHPSHPCTQACCKPRRLVLTLQQRAASSACNKA
jgi:hypothetical protein